MPQTWSYTDNSIRADAMSWTWSYTNTSCSRWMSQTCLRLALIMCSMHVLDMSYTSTQITRMSRREYLIYFLRFKWSSTISIIIIHHHFPNQETHLCLSPV
ncbi:hypothetical protein F383_16159 [Gossypium arboreum]|uniref:Uncharacterized protein n=1 Tax=Gossypium arboreum TaxID=29729 RepID=A0A0B0Q2B9_GOSAR|nr:hypothetical protein F383_16159 [Gossypium arboreum]